MSLTPETLQEIEKFSRELNSRFAPPEYYSGCEVKDISDKDAYAANNGWIEAIVGQHNQQRCRWRGQVENIQVGDLIDVLYFASFQIFVVFGRGGTSAIRSVYGVWPAPGIIMLGTTEYATIAAAIAAASFGDVIKLGEGLYSGSITIDESITIVGTGRNDSIITSTGDTITVDPNVTVKLKNLKVISTNASGTVRAIVCNSDEFIIENCIIEMIDEGAATNAYGIQLGISDTAILYSYDSQIIGKGAVTSSRALYLDNSSIAHIYKGILESDDVLVEALSGCEFYPYRPQALGSVDKFTGAGIIDGEIYGDPHFGVNPMSVYRARVTHSLDQSVGSGGGGTILSFDTEREDTDQFHDPVTNNSRLTAETPGDYDIKFNGEWAAHATGYRTAEILLNGITVIARDTRLPVGGSDPTAQSLATDYSLSAGDYVEVRVWQNSGTGLNILKSGNYSPEFSITKMLG